MKRIVAAALMAGASGLAACEAAPGDVAAGRETVSAAPQSSAGPAAMSTENRLEAGTPIVDGAPAFAVLYPGGVLEAPATLATGPAGPGGLVTFQSEADPEAIVTFYRARAEAAGLSSVMAMNMGEARSYGAAKAGVGTNLQVVASPLDDGNTSVQVSWSAGG